MRWLQRLFSRKSENDDRASRPSPARIDIVAVIQRALEEHAAELQQALTPEIRQKVFALWRQTIDTEAHDYADLVLAYTDRARIIELEVDTFMNAYLSGYMAAHGWIDRQIALQSAFLLGRRLRDQLRAIGLTLNTVSANVGTVLDRTLVNIVTFGLEQTGGAH